MGRQTRTSEIHRRRQRRQKLDHLRRRYAAAKTDGERALVLSQVQKVSPGTLADVFVAAVKAGRPRA